jgi:hypothetical protein
LFRAVFTRTATIEKDGNAFAATGIYSYRPQVICEEDFAPSEPACTDEVLGENLRD